jgi:hypothetical protein
MQSPPPIGVLRCYWCTLVICLAAILRLSCTYGRAGWQMLSLGKHPLYPSLRRAKERPCYQRGASWLALRQPVCARQSPYHVLTESSAGAITHRRLFARLFYLVQVHLRSRCDVTSNNSLASFGSCRTPCA